MATNPANGGSVTAISAAVTALDVININMADINALTNALHV